MWKSHSIHAKYSMCCCTVRQRPICTIITEGKLRMEESLKWASSITRNRCLLRGDLWGEGADDKICVIAVAICPVGLRGASKETQTLIGLGLSFDWCRICKSGKHIGHLAKDRQRWQRWSERPQFNKLDFESVNWKQLKYAKEDEVDAIADNSMLPGATLLAGIYKN